MTLVAESGSLRSITRTGGRGVYFDDRDQHFMEVITQPYGETPEG